MVLHLMGGPSAVAAERRQGAQFFGASALEWAGAPSELGALTEEIAALTAEVPALAHQWAAPAHWWAARPQ